MSLPRYLYHGTSARIARASQEQGLLPRELSGDAEGNWEEFPSRSDCVYLTTTYALFYALVKSATESVEEDDADAAPMGLVRIDVSKLDLTRLLPDEDGLEQVAREDPAILRHFGLDGLSLHERHAWFRENSHMFNHPNVLEMLIQKTGNCAHRGPVAADAIDAVALVAPNSLPNIWQIRDIMPAYMGHVIREHQLRPQLEFIFDQNVELDLSVWTGIPAGTPPEIIPEGMLAMAKQTEQVFDTWRRERPGIQLLARERGEA